MDNPEIHLHYVVNSDMKNVIGMSDPNVMFKGPGPFIKFKLW